MKPEDLPMLYNNLLREPLPKAKGRALDQLASYLTGVPTEVVPVSKMMLFDKKGYHHEEKTSYSCYHSMSPYRFVKFPDGLFKLPSAISDSHGTAPVCDRCPHQLDCVSGIAKVIEAGDLKGAEHRLVEVPVVKENFDPIDPNPYFQRHHTTRKSKNIWTQ